MQCPKCRSRKQEDNFCSKCGTALKGDAAKPKTAATPAPAAVETAGAANASTGDDDKATAAEPAADAATSANTATETAAEPTNKDKYLSIASLVCGLVGLCLFWTPAFGLGVGAIGLGLGLIAGKGQDNKPRTGTIVSAIAIGASMLMILISVIAAAVLLVNGADALIEAMQSGSFDGGFNVSTPSIDI